MQQWIEDLILALNCKKFSLVSPQFIQSTLTKNAKRIFTKLTVIENILLNS